MSTFTLTPLITTSHASDFAGDTVTTMVQSIKNAEGDKDQTLKVFEELAAVITEGKGLGGDVSYGKHFFFPFLSLSRRIKMKETRSTHPL